MRKNSVAAQQEFRVTARKPAGGQKRDTTRPHQEEDIILVYAWGKGDTTDERKLSAFTRARDILSLNGYDRFELNLTIGDEEKMRAHRWNQKYAFENGA